MPARIGGRAAPRSRPACRSRSSSPGAAFSSRSAASPTWLSAAATSATPPTAARRPSGAVSPRARRAHPAWYHRLAVNGFVRRSCEQRPLDEDLQRQARRDHTRLVRRRCRRADPRPSRDADRRSAPRQGQAAVHPARGHGRFRRRRERREDRGHRQQARQKIYYRHSGYPGGLRERPLREQLQRRPTEVLRKAVKGMLPATSSAGSS